MSADIIKFDSLLVAEVTRKVMEKYGLGDGYAEKVRSLIVRLMEDGTTDRAGLLARALV